MNTMDYMNEKIFAMPEGELRETLIRIAGVLAATEDMKKRGTVKLAIETAYDHIMDIMEG